MWGSQQLRDLGQTCLTSLNLSFLICRMGMTVPPRPPQAGFKPRRNHTAQEAPGSRPTRGPAEQDQTPAPRPRRPGGGYVTGSGVPPPVGAQPGAVLPARRPPRAHRGAASSPARLVRASVRRPRSGAAAASRA